MIHGITGFFVLTIPRYLIPGIDDDAIDDIKKFMLKDEKSRDIFDNLTKNDIIITEREIYFPICENFKFEITESTLQIGDILISKVFGWWQIIKAELIGEYPPVYNILLERIHYKKNTASFDFTKEQYSTYKDKRVIDTIRKDTARKKNKPPVSMY